jgi:hypothetical protein
MKNQKIHTICTRSLQKNESRSEPTDSGTAAIVRVALGRAEARCPPEKEREELGRRAMVVVDGAGELGRHEEAGARSGRCRRARAPRASARCRAQAGWRQCRGGGRRPALEGGGLGEAGRRRRRRPGRGAAVRGSIGLGPELGFLVSRPIFIPCISLDCGMVYIKVEGCFCKTKSTNLQPNPRAVIWVARAIGR